VAERDKTKRRTEKEGKIIILASEMVIAVFPGSIKNFLLSTPFRPALGPTQPRI
jgi:hypothetical protein